MVKSIMHRLLCTLLLAAQTYTLCQAHDTLPEINQSTPTHKKPFYADNSAQTTSLDQQDHEDNDGDDEGEEADDDQVDIFEKNHKSKLVAGIGVTAAAGLMYAAYSKFTQTKSKNQLARKRYGFSTSVSRGSESNNLSQTQLKTPSQVVKEEKSDGEDDGLGLMTTRASQQEIAPLSPNVEPGSSGSEQESDEEEGGKEESKDDSFGQGGDLHDDLTLQQEIATLPPDVEQGSSLGNKQDDEEESDEEESVQEVSPWIFTQALDACGIVVDPEVQKEIVDIKQEVEGDQEISFEFKKQVYWFATKKYKEIFIERNAEEKSDMDDYIYANFRRLRPDDVLFSAISFRPSGRLILEEVYFLSRASRGIRISLKFIGDEAHYRCNFDFSKWWKKIDSKKVRVPIVTLDAKGKKGIKNKQVRIPTVTLDEEVKKGLLNHLIYNENQEGMPLISHLLTSTDKVVQFVCQCDPEKQYGYDLIKKNFYQMNQEEDMQLIGDRQKWAKHQQRLVLSD